MRKNQLVLYLGLFIFLFLLLLPLNPAKTANQQAELVKNINTRSALADSDPSSLINLNGILYFAAADDIHGTELWKSDGTETGTVMVRDIRPGTYASSMGGGLGQIVVMNNTLYFPADDGINRHALWKSDGTETGTVMVKDPNPGGYSSIQGLTVVNNTLYFTAYLYSYGRELWRSDGTEAGTYMVKDIYPGANSGIWDLTNVDGTLYFGAEDGAHGGELWKSDGTEVGTTLVKDVFGELNPHELTNLNGTLFFASDYALWKSDGTANGTVMVKDFNPDNISGGDRITSMTSINNSLLMRVGVIGEPGDLWISDGTINGTILIRENVGAILSYEWANPNVIINDTLFFSAVNGTPVSELWKSDGTVTGTVMVAEVGSSWFANVDGTLYFAGNDETHGGELWKSDGTAAGTVIVADIRPGENHSSPRFLTEVNGSLFFSADDHIYGRELWKLAMNLNTSNQNVYLPVILK